MKKALYPVALAILIIGTILSNCSEEPGGDPPPYNLLGFDSIRFQPSMKGWELYSWPERNDYSHSLLIGTNRLKTLNEVKNNTYVVHGTDSLKLLLGCVPAGEQIHWIGRDWLERCWQSQSYGSLMVPDDLVVTEIRAFCEENELELYVSEN